jgi:hypothetical protein
VRSANYDENAEIRMTNTNGKTSKARLARQSFVIRTSFVIRDLSFVIPFELLSIGNFAIATG